MDKKLVICEAYNYCDYKYKCPHIHTHSLKCLDSCVGSLCPYMNDKYNKKIYCKPVKEVVNEKERQRLSCNV